MVLTLKSVSNADQCSWITTSLASYYKQQIIFFLFFVHNMDIYPLVGWYYLQGICSASNKLCYKDNLKWCSISFFSWKNKAWEQRSWCPFCFSSIQRSEQGQPEHQDQLYVNIEVGSMLLFSMIALPVTVALSHSKAGLAVHLWKHVAMDPQPL